MTSFFVRLRKADREGTCRLHIRIVHKRKDTSVATPFSAEKNDVTRSGKLKSQRLIDACDQIIRQYRDKITELGVKADSMDVQQIKQYLIGNSAEDNANKIDVLAYTQQYINELKRTGHDGLALNHQTSLNSIKKFSGLNVIYTEDFTDELLRSWVKWLTETTSGRAPFTYMAHFHAIWRKMQKQFNNPSIGYMPIADCPFDRVDVPKQKPAKKRALTIEQMRQIWNNRGTLSPIQERSRDIFLLSFLLMGMNLADIYECDCIEDGRIVYNRKKTRNRRPDGAEMSVKIEDEVQYLLDRYKDRNGERVFDFHNIYHIGQNFTSVMNAYLKEVGKQVGVDNLTIYAARHSWATIAYNDCNIDKYTVHQALCHIDKSTAITDVYIKKDYRKQDEANRKVIDYLIGKPIV